MESMPAPAAAPGRGTLALAGTGSLLYAVISLWSGTWRPALNAWFTFKLVQEYVRGLLAPTVRTGGALDFWRAAVARGATLRTVLRLEVDHQRKVIAAGGAAAVAKDPTQLWRQGLLHVRTARQADKAAKQLGGVGSPMAGPVPLLRDLVLVGGGHSHAHVLLMLGMEPVPGVRVTLITRDTETPYSGMLPGHVAGYYTKEECHIDLVKLGRFANVRVVHAEVTHIDVETQRIHMRSCLDPPESATRPPLRYDVLSLDVGCSPSTIGGVSGYDMVRGGGLGDHVCTVKPIDGFSRKFERLVDQVQHWTAPQDVIIVGGGAGGVELALSVQHRLQQTLLKLGKPQDWAQVAVVSRSAAVMPNHAVPVRSLMESVLFERGIKVHGKHCALRLAEDSGDRQGLVCQCEGEEVTVPFDECIWCTDGAAQSWTRDLPLELDSAGFLVVETTLQARRKGGDVLQNFFAAGDCATIRGHPRPKAGVFAVMAGMPLYKNIRATLLGGHLEPYIPQAEFLGIIGLGRGGAIASKGEVALKADWLWDLKDWIDQTWMWKYTRGLPNMGGDGQDSAAAQLAGRIGPDALELLRSASMRCAGCGSKVGSTVLSGAIDQLLRNGKIHRNADIRLGLDSLDDCAVLQPPGSQSVSVHTVDFFRALVGDPYIFGRIAALHALSDCFAMGARPEMALAICTVQMARDEIMEEDLFHMMAGANYELAKARCTLAGGHTTEGSECSLGFCITGSAARLDNLMVKGGMKAGDVLLLTKPLGTGCIFAAEMRRQVRGLYVAETLRSVLRSNGPAAEIALRCGANACTDVTGFGLAGHLVEMCKAGHSACCISISLDEVPILAGAEALVRAGITSSLQAANERARRAFRNEAAAAAAFAAGRLPKYPLLFDPQTNGGLLIAVPAASKAACMKAFEEAGETCWEIGAVMQRPREWEAGDSLLLRWLES